MGSSFIQSVVMLTDSSFLSRYSTTAFDAAGNGGLIYVTLFVALMGMSDGAQILMARRIGEEKEGKLAQLFGTSLFTNFILALLLFGAIQFILPSLVNSITKHHDIAAGEIEFVKIRSFGLFFVMISLTIMAYFTSLGKTYIVLLSAIITAFVNIGLDYGLIFGKLGLPAMGLEGAAIASTLADGAAMLFLLVALIFSNSRKEHHLFRDIKVRYESFRALLKVGSPILFQGLIALTTWTAFFIWIEQTGKYELTVSQTIRSLYFLAFVPIWGFAGTTKTYISQYIGHKEFDKIKTVQRRIQILTLISLVVIFHGAVLYPEYLVQLINPKVEYLSGSAEILQFISGSVLIYGYTSVYFQMINGSGNTKFTFYIEAISVAIYLLFSYLFIKVWDWDIYWIWGVEYIYFITLGALSFGYIKLFNWQKKLI
jgi:putative MATE family efflux protein